MEAGRSSLVAVSREDGGAVAVLRLDNPPVNAINSAILADLADALRAVEDDDEVGAVVLTGNGKGFCAGATREPWVRAVRWPSTV